MQAISSEKKPSVRKSFIAKSVEEGADIMLGVLKGIKGFALDEKDLKPHTHIDDDDVEYQCVDMGCNIWFWNHPEVKAILAEYEELEDWVGRNLHRFLVVLGLKLEKNDKRLLGIALRLGNRRIRLVHLAKWGSAIIASGLIGRFSAGWILYLPW